MSLQQKFWTVMGAVLALLMIASLIGWVLARRARSDGAREVVANLNARIGAWWWMVAILCVCFLLGRVATLVLFGNPAQHRNTRARVVPLQDARTHIEGLMKSSKAVVGVLRPEEVQFLFPDHNRQIGSAAVVPLNAGYPLGMLAIAMTDPNYFRSSMGTLFLGYIAEVLNRQLPKLLRPAY